MIKLHLGCGKRHASNMINIDIQQYEGAVDIVCDCTKDLPFEKESVNLIYSCAMLEHLDRQSWREVLTYWFELLKPNGEIQISTSDFDAICERYKEKRNINELVGLLLGGSKTNSYMDRHGIMFSFDFLKEEMEKIGFKNVERCDYNKFEPYKNDKNYDDFSAAFLDNKLMVLNVRAYK
jgi:predicted SAM-dependent methyltransferase